MDDSDEGLDDEGLYEEASEDLDDDPLEDDPDEEENEDQVMEEVVSNGKSQEIESKVSYCRICGALVIVDELPDSISKDAFEQFGLCLNCQWGVYMDNGGHF